MLDKLDLGGSWLARWNDGWRGYPLHTAEREDTDLETYYPAIVPGEVHLDLMRAGVIGDPDIGTNCQNARWVEECLWVMRRTFEAPAAALAGARAWLVFERLELVAKVILNGVEVGRSSNTFHPCRIDVTGKLKAGTNILVVHLESGLYDVADKQAAGYVGFADQALHKRHWLRAPQSQFTWDWSPRLINVGITAPARLEWSKAPLRVEGMTPLATVSDDLAVGKVRVRVFAEAFGKEPVPATVRAEIGGVSATAEIRVVEGVRAYEVTLEVAKPRLWWPVGHGEATLHRVDVRVECAGHPAWTATARVGFRRARVVQEADATGSGRGFILEINNCRIFAKGGNMVPADLIRARIDRARYVGLIDRALEANFNLLRVWGGGLYEADDFYDLCDERGILVWQEFIFACSRFPGTDAAFWNSVKTEATYNIRRLGSHASLVIWCGNNEIEWGYWDWGYDKGVVQPDHAIYHHLLPRLLAEEDPTRYYQPSSPYSPDNLHPNREDVGDQHPWGTIFNDADIHAFRRNASRFPNEGGVLGPNALPTVLECLPADQRRIGSHAWKLHDNAIAQWNDPKGWDPSVREWTGVHERKIPLEAWVHLAGLFHGEGLREYSDNFRRRMFTSAAAVFWMYNDCWPTTRSWTIVDHRLRRTPAFHHVRRAFLPVNVVVTADADEVLVHGVNERAESVRATLRFGVFGVAGGFPLDHSVEVELPPNTATVIARFPRARWADPKSAIPFAELRSAGRLIARNRLIEPRFVDVAWADAKPTVTVQGGVATFRCATFAWGVCLDLDGERQLEDNLFDLWPGIDYAIAWPHADAPRILYTGNQAIRGAAKQAQA